MRSMCSCRSTAARSSASATSPSDARSSRGRTTLAARCPETGPSPDFQLRSGACTLACFSRRLPLWSATRRGRGFRLSASLRRRCAYPGARWQCDRRGGRSVVEPGSDGARRFGHRRPSDAARRRAQRYALRDRGRITGSPPAPGRGQCRRPDRAARGDRSHPAAYRFGEALEREPATAASCGIGRGVPRSGDVVVR